MLRKEEHTPRRKTMLGAFDVEKTEIEMPSCLPAIQKIKCNCLLICSAMI
jgi:hypothetical protein